MQQTHAQSFEPLLQVLGELADALEVGDWHLIAELRGTLRSGTGPAAPVVAIVKEEPALLEELKKALEFAFADSEFVNIPANGMEGPIRTAPGAINYIKAGMTQKPEPRSANGPRLRNRVNRLRAAAAPDHGMTMTSWAPLPNTIAQNAIQYDGKSVPPSTIAGWRKKDPPLVQVDPLTKAVHVPRDWVDKHLATYRPGIRIPKRTLKA